MVTVVYIIGAGNSGSTILSMVLGAHSHMMSVGELSHIEKYRTENKKCSCGQYFLSCDFWQHMKGDLSDDLALYQEIQNQSGIDIVVDASKDIRRLKALCKKDGIRVVPLYVVRDGRAYIDSYLRRGGRSVLKALWRWVRMNVRARSACSSLRHLQPLQISYEEFAQNPEQVLDKACDRLGVAFESDMLNYHTQMHHNIAGTRSRFDLKPITPYESWRERLPRRAHLAFILSGGPLWQEWFRKAEVVSPRQAIEGD